MPQCSPTKWHRAHTTWFFETFVLGSQGIGPLDPRYSQLFNSYYVAIGPRHAQARRGLLSRPSVAEIAEYRQIVDERMLELLERVDERTLGSLAPLIALGLAHEQQHQELLLTDILHALHENPLAPFYRSGSLPFPELERTPEGTSKSMRFVRHEGGLADIGLGPSPGFRFDNEEPRHKIWLQPFALSDRLVTVGEWKAFARAGGYETPSLWLSEGFDWVTANGVSAPLYAKKEGDALLVFGLDGLREAQDSEPVTHVSYYEADALARFLEARLPTEAEWEAFASKASLEGNFLEDGALRALPARPPRSEVGVSQLFGDAWEWTCSSYSPYPGYCPSAGAVGEYNGKFMVNQLVLRGGSCFTPQGHVRPSYRNFWHPFTRFQVMGVRLARSWKG